MDVRKPGRLYMILLMFLLCIPICRRMQACSCGGTGTCHTRQSYGIQFLGTVLQVRVVDHEHPRPDSPKYWAGGHRVVTLSVKEDFSGRFAPGHLLEVTTGMGGGDCGFPFREGEHYLVDATEHDATYSTGMCTRTAPEGAAGVFLHELRALAAGRRIPDVMGSVVHFSSNYGAGERAPVPVPDLPVTLTGLDGRIIHTQTGADGVFALNSVPMGSYGVEYEIPKGLISRDGQNSDGVNVPYAWTAGAGCELEFALYSAGRLKGRVVNAHGEGVHGYVSADQQEPGSTSPVGNVANATTGPDGSFDLAPLDAGQYRLRFIPDDTQGQMWWYPGSTLRTEASFVWVDEGKTTSGVLLKVRP